MIYNTDFILLLMMLIKNVSQAIGPAELMAFKNVTKNMKISS